MERVLHVAEDSYRDLFHSIDLGFCVLERIDDAAERPVDFRFLEVNSAFEKQAGISNATGKTVRELIPECEPHWFEIFGRVADTGVAMRFEGREKNLGRWFDVYAFRFGGAGSRRVAACFSDITSHKNAQNALHESEEQFRTLADNISQLAWMGDETGSIFWYNKRWYDYTGSTFDEMKGWGWRLLHHPDHVDRVTEKFREHMQAGKPWEDTFPLRSKDGEYRWFLSRALPIQDEEGKVVRWFGTNTDVTEQREHQARMQTVMAELNHRVKNSLAVVSAIAHQTASTSSDLQSFSVTFLNRLKSIAQAHSLLTRTEWRGCDLNEVVQSELHAQLEAAGRVKISVPRCCCRRSTALRFI